MQKFTLFILAVFACASGRSQVTNGAVADTLYSVQLHEIDVRAKWKNNTERYHYNQMKFYVTTILPYLNAATKLFLEINEKCQDSDLSRKDRRKFVNKKEEEMRTEFEDRVKDLNVTQGALLIKLIARQTDMNIYQTLKEFKNPLVAIKWQAWARLNGMNLDRKYHPDEERDLELIMDELGYPLPVCYATASAQ